MGAGYWYLRICAMAQYHDEDGLARPRDRGDPVTGQRRSRDDLAIDDDAGWPPVGTDRGPGPVMGHEGAEGVVEAVVGAAGPRSHAVGRWLN